MNKLCASIGILLACGTAAYAEALNSETQLVTVNGQDIRVPSGTFVFYPAPNQEYSMSGGVVTIYPVGRDAQIAASRPKSTVDQPRRVLDITDGKATVVTK